MQQQFNNTVERPLSEPIGTRGGSEKQIFLIIEQNAILQKTSYSVQIHCDLLYIASGIVIIHFFMFEVSFFVF